MYEDGRYWDAVESNYRLDWELKTQVFACPVSGCGFAVSVKGVTSHSLPTHCRLHETLVNLVPITTKHDYEIAVLRYAKSQADNAGIGND